MKSHTLNRQDQITVIGFLACFKKECDHNGIKEGAAVWRFQFNLTGQSHALIQCRHNGNTIAVDAGQREMLSTYLQIVNFFVAHLRD